MMITGQHRFGAGQRQEPYSMDRTSHISYEAGILEDPWFDSYDLKNRDYFTTLSVLPEDRANKPEFVTIDFNAATPSQ